MTVKSRRSDRAKTNCIDQRDQCAKENVCVCVCEQLKKVNIIERNANENDAVDCSASKIRSLSLSLSLLVN